MYRFDDFAEQYLGWNGKGTTKNVMVLCLWHDDSSPSMSFNRETGQYNCFSCPAQGSITSLARKVGLVVQSTGYVAEFDDPLADARDFGRMMDELLAEGEPPTPLPESTLRAFQAVKTDYWKSRDLTADTITAWELGYSRFRNQATLPVRAPFSDDLLGVIRRNLDPAVKPKYLNPKLFQKNRTLFGSWLPNDRDAEHPHRIVLTEGPVDAVKVWQAGFNGRAIMGSKLAREQVMIMLKYGIEQVVLFLDDDAAGFRAALAAFGRLERRFDVTAAVYPPGVRATDPGGLTDQQISRAVDGAVDLTNIFSS